MRPTPAPGAPAPAPHTAWVWPLDLERYERSPLLTAEESALLMRRARYPHRLGHWTALFQRGLSRLTQPLTDALDYLRIQGRTRTAVQQILTAELYQHHGAYWGWSPAQWRAVLGESRQSFGATHAAAARPGARSALLGVAYLLCRHHEIRLLGKYERVTLAYRVFGRERIEAALERILAPLLAWGYSALARDGLRMALCEVFLQNQSPRLEDISYKLLDGLRQQGVAHRTRGCLLRLSRALVGLGMLERALGLWGGGHHHVSPEGTEGIAAGWVSCVQRWRDTTTLSPPARQAYYGQLLMVGRWASTTHPEAALPEQWTRETPADCVAMICRKHIGEWAAAHRLRSRQERHKPLSPRTQQHFLNTLSVFFRDCQEWEWIPRRFDAARAFAQPRHVRALIGPNPRVLTDEVWAKLLWAGLHLSEQDLSSAFGGESFYPLTMIRALTVIWLFAGLRQGEIRRLRLGCVRLEGSVGEGEKEAAAKAICLLDIPVTKTSTAFTKPVDPVVGEAIQRWEQERPTQPLALDEKTGERVHFLFSFRCGRFSLNYLNRTLIPALCQKAGIPVEDARGRITSNRARSTIATQLFNARQPFSLFELQEWLGHRTPQSTQHDAKISPTKLARSYADAAYFQRNLRTIEVLIDQDVVRRGAAGSEPWRFYDLGHGYCTYDFFDQCPHRMACARCAFYRPKESTAALFAEGKGQLLRLKQEISLTEAEAAAVDEGVQAFDRLLG